MSGGMPQVAALSVTYLISFTSAAENALNSPQASFGVALRSLAARIAFARFCASSRNLPNSCAQAGTCCGCPAHGDGAAWRCCCGGADHGDGAVCCGCCGHGAVAAVEQQQGIPAFEAEHIAQVIGLFAFEGHLAAAGQRRIEVNAGGTEIVSRHEVVSSQIWPLKVWPLTVLAGRKGPAGADFGGLPPSRRIRQVVINHLPGNRLYNAPEASEDLP